MSVMTIAYNLTTKFIGLTA